jgi:8-oxo-dGTP pyrophosphatase MutT (NUDIX family)
MVRAAGGVVVRGGQVAVVHRPHREDWTLPKGKLEPGEDDVAAAVREVREETGWAVEPAGDLGSVSYALPDGSPKSVHWFLMQPIAQVGETAADVDEVRWLDPAGARELLTYELDAQVLRLAGLW